MAQGQATEAGGARRLAAAQQGWPLLSTGVFLHPADLVPLPSDERKVVAKVIGRDGYGQPTEEEVPLDAVPACELIFPDGSAKPHPVKELGRAS